MKIFLYLIFGLMCSQSIAGQVDPLAPILMESTFKIEGPTPNGKTAFGTCFIFLIPNPSDTNSSRIVLVTANHVLGDLAGDTAVVNLRNKTDGGGWTPRQHTITIRTNNTPLWVSHPEADVAALLVQLPVDIVNEQRWLNREYLASDNLFKERDIQPGDELMCLGYPLSLQANDFGFPILRSGRIASYPVWPISLAKTFLYDIPVYGGNSGGPVFYDFRKRRIPGDDSSKWIDTIGIAGLISKDVSQTVQVESYFESLTRRDPLGLAVVVPAEYIQQTLDLLIETRLMPQQGGGPLR
ncbi:MAG TPA: serine protease [Kiritimatiellia bacterium]|nr:serine protease [Kiritimatiellia bacterium]HMP00590.1 serine protease [Kiritimatiellia bacterium]